MEEIIRMQQNLLLIRRTVGWTAEEFGDKIGVTRQTINNIESGRNKLSKTQYIAMRSVLDAEILRSPQDTEMLKLLLDVLVDSPENYSDEDVEILVAKANMLTPSILAGTTSRKDVSNEWITSIRKLSGVSASAGLFGAAGAMALSTWLAKALGDNRKKDR